MDDEARFRILEAKRKHLVSRWLVEGTRAIVKACTGQDPYPTAVLAYEYSEEAQRTMEQQRKLAPRLTDE